MACAAARSRCSGGNPCGRCDVRKLECTYPSKRRKGNDDSHDVKHESATIQGQVSINVQPSGEQQPFRFYDPHGAASSNSFAPQSQGHASQTDDITPSIEYRNDEQGNGLQGIVPPPPNHFSQHQHASTTHASTASYYNGPDQAQMPNLYHQADPAYDYPAWDDSLNWIPISVYPSPFDGELENDFSFLLPPLDDSTALNYDYNGTIPPSHDPQIYQNVAAGSIQSTRAEWFTDSHGPSNPLTGSVQSPTSSASNEISTARSGLKAGSKKRRKSSSVIDIFSQPRSNRRSNSFPTKAFSDIDDNDVQTPQYCSKAVYESLTAAFDRLCRAGSDAFDVPTFVGAESINYCIKLYFDNFHDNFPLLHKPTFGVDTPWIVALAATTIGSAFVRAPHALEFRRAFQEFLRRAVTDTFETSSEDIHSIPLHQARILNLVSLSQAENDNLRSMTARYHAELVQFCLESGVLQVVNKDATSTTSDVGPGRSSSDWSSWIEVESRRRIAYLTWKLDTSLGYMCNLRPMCNVDDARTPMPCREELWSAETFDDWVRVLANTSPSPSLCAALEHLYNKKAVHPGLSDLGQVLLINALFQRTWEVGTHIKQPFSEWIPTGKARGFLNTPTKDDFWLPLYPLYANWRNSACDCLDVINWQAASIVAKASGVEHNLMLHLHLARIVLLTPFQEIQDLLFSLIGRVDDSSRASFYVHDGSYQPRNRQKLPQIRKITWRWLREDQHKARLAMIHAGSVFWHVRRYSSSSFYEPLAVYLASIVLWTYGSYKSAALERANASTKPVGGPSGPDSEAIVQPSRVERKIRVQDIVSREPEDEDAHAEVMSESASSTDSAQPEFIHLDRPCDDEMIQHFVRNGNNMTGHMSNIGDVCKAPSKILLEGAKLLRTRLSCWGVSREYYDVLTKLAEMRKA